MTRLIVDRETLTRLGPFDKPLQICDETGHTLGFFQPLAPGDYEPLLDPAEIARRKQIKEGRALKEIVADLERRQ